MTLQTENPIIGLWAATAAHGDISRIRDISRPCQAAPAILRCSLSRIPCRCPASATAATGWHKIW